MQDDEIERQPALLQDTQKLKMINLFKKKKKGKENKKKREKKKSSRR
jgi:hypothetical protein